MDVGAFFPCRRRADLEGDCGSFPSADVDAIGAIGSGLGYILSSSTLFDSGEYALKDTTKLLELAETLEPLGTC